MDATSLRERPRVRLVPAGAVVPAVAEPDTIAVGADLAVPLPDRSAQRVDATAIIATNPERALAFIVECRRVLAPNGTLACAAPPRALPLDRYARLAGLSPVEDAADGRTFIKPSRQLKGDPLVSVVIPAFAPRFFAASLASAIAQDYEPLEIVVCDESPNDEIAAIVGSAARARPIRYFRNRERLGARGNLARGLAEARGEFVKYLNDDDCLAPDCVSRLVAAFRAAPDVVLATSWRRRIDALGHSLPDRAATIPIAASDVLIGGTSLANTMLLAGLNFVGEPSTAMFRRADFPDAGDATFHFDGVAARGAVDFAMWANLLLRGDAVWYRRNLSDFRVHPGQSQQDPSKTPRAVEGIRSLQAAWLALGLHHHLRPHEILRQPFPPDGDAGWQWASLPPLAGLLADRWRAPPSDRWRYGH